MLLYVHKSLNQMYMRSFTVFVRNMRMHAGTAILPTGAGMGMDIDFLPAGIIGYPKYNE